MTSIYWKNKKKVKSVLIDDLLLMVNTNRKHNLCTMKEYWMGELYVFGEIDLDSNIFLLHDGMSNVYMTINEISIDTTGVIDE